MPDSATFDNRYRYDHIYPRGRSGETLRAWDTRENDRPVVIKRPAPQDAPPMRAAQEVSIKAERKALERMADHPVVAQLRASGSFRVGGQTHEYIVMDRAEGDIVEQDVLELVERGDRLPLLETLVIADQLLDMLETAHEEQVVYNDVDAKHLFWNRDRYTLTVIDWGNAVLLDEGGGPSGVTRQTDIYQVGELLYFILTGGSRLDSTTTAEGEYMVNFGEDMLRIPPNVQSLITRATHPNVRRRFTTVKQLRDDLKEIIRPLQRKRDALLEQIHTALQQPQSPQALEDLKARAHDAYQMDPAYPETRRLQQQIELQQKRLELQSDIDAALIYLENSNWSRARELMVDLQAIADDQTGAIIEFIMAAADIMAQADLKEPPHTLIPAVNALLAGEPRRAGQTLLAGQDPSQMQFLLADRMTALISEVLLLRPPLFAIENAPQIDDRTRNIIASILGQLDAPDHQRLQPLIEAYQDTIAELNNLRPVFEKLTHDEDLDRAVLLDPLGRAQSAAQAVMQHLQAASLYVFSDPGQAGQNLRGAIGVDPLNPNLGVLNDYFAEIHEAVGALGSFKPARDGSNLNEWFERVLSFLQPYGDDLDDRAFHQTLAAIEKIARRWSEVQDYLILGRRTPAADLFQQLASLVQSVNQNLAQWFTETARQVQDATHIERLSANERLGQRLIEGYQLWDQGKYAQAVDHVEKIADYAETQGERLATDRLLRLSDLADVWLSTGGTNDLELTRQSDMAVMDLLLEDERLYHDQFIADTRRSEDLYLKMMGRGLVDWMRGSSSAAPRALFLHYIWSGMLAAQHDEFEEAAFWREAALKTSDTARTNPLFADFDNYLTGRQLVIEVQKALNKVNTPQGIIEARNLLNQPMADQWLGPIQEAVRQLQDGIKQWQDGNFQLTRTALEESLRKLRSAQENYRIDLRNLISWVEALTAGSIKLHGKFKEIERIANTARPSEDGTPKDVDPVLSENFGEFVTVTESLLGTESAYQLRQWQQTYEDIRQTHQSDFNRNEKLIAFEAHFNNLFIDKHPAYPLFQIWRRTAQNLPEPIAPLPETLGKEPETASTVAEPAAPAQSVPAEPDSTPTPRRTATAPPTTSPPADEAPLVYEDDFGSDVVYQDSGRGDIPWTALIGLGVVAIAVIAFILMGGLGEDADNGGTGDGNEGIVNVPSETLSSATTAVLGGADDPTLTPTVTETRVSATFTNEPATATDVPATTAAPSDTAVVPTATSTTAPATDTPVVPTVTSTMPPATPTFTEASVSVLGSPPQNILNSLNNNRPTACDWDPNWFTQGAGGLWQLGARKQEAGSGPIVVTISPACLEALLGPQAAQRIKAIEIEFELRLYDDNDVTTGNVSFGFGVQNESRQRTAGEIKIIDTNPVIASYGLNQNGAFRFSTQLAGNPSSTMRIERLDNGVIRFFVNSGQRLGDSEIVYDANAALSPVLYTSGGGIFVAISQISFELGPVN